MRRLIAILAAFVLLLAACMPIQPATDGSIPRPTRPPSDETTSELPEIARLARAFLADELGIAADTLEVVEVEAVEWPDGCLGVYEPDEVCIMAITPGYRVVLRAGDKTYAVHTNQSGDALRLAPQIDTAREPQPAPSRVPREEPPVDPQATSVGDAVRAALAAELEVDADSIAVTSVEAVDWPDACLEVYRPDEMCATVITPGYRVTLDVASETYIVHTNVDAANIRIAAGPESE